MPKNILYKKENVYTKYPEDLQAIEDFAVEYRDFIDYSKTERRAVEYSVDFAVRHGFSPYEEGKVYSPGDKFYYVNRSKAIYLVVVGKDSLKHGFSLVAAHIDSPRLDLKQVPLYESEGLAYFKTHYYGGIKKYQWTSLPLSLHGVIYTKDGAAVDISIGDDPSDPVFFISDLLPHLGKDQMQKKMSEGITGEGLNLIVGSIPDQSEDLPEATKLSVMKLLNEKYGITERDFMTAELSAVPAQNSREVGFDRGLIAAYGHDDRVCSFPALAAVCRINNPQKTAVAALVDKEEIGSYGVTGLVSASFFDFMADLCESQGVSYRECFKNSFSFSADVGAAYDPGFPEVFEKNNTAIISNGIVISKYAGSRGKSGASDASAEAVSKTALLLDKNHVLWQSGEYGKVDQGGGGTVSTELARYNIEVVDIGVPVLSMHSPIEICSKADLYMMYKACTALYKG